MSSPAAKDQKLIKLLEKKIVIQLFGLGLILAPFINTCLIISDFPADYPKWTLNTFIQVFSAGVLFQRILNVASVVIGFALLKGVQHAWKFVLLLLSGYIIMQITYLGKNFREQPSSVLFFVINIGLFLFIADQLAFKQKVPAVKPQVPVKPVPLETPPERQPFPLSAKPTPRVHTRHHLAKIMIHLDGFGVWAQLISMSTEGIEVRRLGKAPEEMTERLIEFTLPTGVQMRAKLASHSGDVFYFEYLNLSGKQKSDLGQWILIKTEKKTA